MCNNADLLTTRGEKKLNPRKNPPMASNTTVGLSTKHGKFGCHLIVFAFVK